jgi:hypothetical protein
MLVAVEGEEVVGMIGWAVEGDVAEIEALNDRPDRWGTPAVGSLLEATRAMVDDGTSLRLWTLRDNGRARALYESHWFGLLRDVRTITYLGDVVSQVRYESLGR